MKRKVVLYAAIVISVALNIALAYKLRQFGHFEQSKAEQKADRLLKPGTAVPPIQVVDTRGQSQTIAYDNEGVKETVLYVFTPPCHWCAANMDNLKQLVAQKGDEFRFIGVSLSKDGLPEYLDKNGLTMPVV